MEKILFLCSANVWRSQMGEWYYNYFSNSKNWFSAALVEDRREKYWHSPAIEIAKLMLQDWIDISEQKVKLLNKEMCEAADKVILFLNPEDIKSEFQIEWKNATDFLMNNYADKLIIFQIHDPFWEWIEKQYMIKEQIKEIAKNIFFNSKKYEGMQYNS